MNNIKDKIENKPFYRVWDSVYSIMCSSVRHKVSYRVWDSAHYRVRARVYAGVVDKVNEQY